MAEKEKHFNFVLSDTVLRGMNRQQYKAVSRWLRISRNLCEEAIDWDVVRKTTSNLMLYGCGELPENVIKPEYQ